MTFDGFSCRTRCILGFLHFSFPFKFFMWVARETEPDGRTKRTKTSKWWIRFILSQSVIESYFRGAADGTRLQLWMLIPSSTHYRLLFQACYSGALRIRKPGASKTNSLNCVFLPGFIARPEPTPIIIIRFSLPGLWQSKKSLNDHFRSISSNLERAEPVINEKSQRKYKIHKPRKNTRQC